MMKMSILVQKALAKSITTITKPFSFVLFCLKYFGFTLYVIFKTTELTMKPRSQSTAKFRNDQRYLTLSQRNRSK